MRFDVFFITKNVVKAVVTLVIKEIAITALNTITSIGQNKTEMNSFGISDSFLDLVVDAQMGRAGEIVVSWSRSKVTVIC